MKTVYTVHRRGSFASVYTPLTPDCEDVDQAFARTGRFTDLRWKRTGSGTGWYLELDPSEGGHSWLITEHRVAETDAERVELALDLIRQYGGVEGDHHKTWVLDQVVRTLTGDGYAVFVADACNGEDGPGTWEWDEGIAP